MIRRVRRALATAAAENLFLYTAALAFYGSAGGATGEYAWLQLS
ncbi:MAG TPA: hypothetical protein VFH30_15750 [Acidimicrobiales bacterium]|nr:hypothetical protein [Acidimicrobiales bacterium]